MAHRRAEDYSPRIQSGSGLDECPCCWIRLGECCRPRKAQVFRRRGDPSNPAAQAAVEQAFASPRSPTPFPNAKRFEPASKLRIPQVIGPQHTKNAPLSSITPIGPFDLHSRLFLGK